MQFSVNAHHVEGAVLEFASCRLYGQRIAGGHQLGLILEGGCSPSRKNVPPLMIEQVAGVLSVEVDGKHLQISHLFLAQGALPIRQYDYRGTVQLVLTAEAMPGAFEEIERVRGSADVHLIIQLHGTARIWVEDPRAKANQSIAPIASHQMAVGMYSNPHTYTVPQSEWVRVLEEMGYAKHLLIEVGYPTSSANSPFGAACGHVAVASQALRERRWKDAVSECRLAIERLQEVIGSPPSRSDHKSYTKDERYTVLAESLRRITHLAHHVDPIPAATTFSREDAVALVAATATLVQLQGA